MVFSPLGWSEGREGRREGKGWGSGRSWRIDCEALHNLAPLSFIKSSSASSLALAHHCVHPCQSQPSDDGGGPSDDVHGPRSCHDGDGAPQTELALGAGRAEQFGRFGCSVFGLQCGATSGGGLSKKCNGNEIDEMMVSILHLRRGRDDVSYHRCAFSFFYLGSGFWV